MKKLFSLIFIFIATLIFAQMQTYKFENIVQYRIKNDFYSDYLNIFSTKDYNAHLMITQTPMGNLASLKIGDNMYSVYSEEKNPKVFKIDFEGTKDLLGNVFLTTDNPSLENHVIGTNFIANKTNKKEIILDKSCDIYNVFRKDNEQDEGTEICIDTKSTINTVPFINSELNLKGLIYRVGQQIILEKVETLEAMLKEDSKENKKISADDSIFQFDEKAEVEEYKNEYKKQKE